jgi:hypothetical protein
VLGGKQVADERVELPLDHRGRRGIGGAVVGGEREQAGAGFHGRACFVEDPPVARLQLPESVTSSSSAYCRISRAPKSVDHLDRIMLITDAGDDLVELAAEPLARGYARHQGVPDRRLPGQRGGYARFISPG